jgi:hypothetical protein
MLACSEERCELGATLIATVDEYRAALGRMGCPARKRFYRSLAVGKDVGMIPIDIENERAVSAVGVKVATILVSLNEKARLAADVHW